MSLATTAPGTLPPIALGELRAARQALENPTLAARLAGAAGMPIDALRARLPTVVQGGLDTAVRAALSTAMATALRSDPARTSKLISGDWLHRGLAAATGALGGAFGLPGTRAELPVSTTILLRQVAAVAAEQGEDLTAPGAAAECLKVFALGGTSAADDAAESGYFAVRLTLAEALKGGLTQAVVPRFVSAVAARFTGAIGLKVAAQAAPIVGAATGAAINLVFLAHLRGVARAHFTLRRLERQHGAATVRAAWQDISATRDEPFLVPSR